MKIFLAGASGVIGSRLIPLLVADGHAVVGMTRSRSKSDLIRSLGASPVVCDVFDLDALVEAADAAAPEIMIHQLSDLPDDPRHIADHVAPNARIRREGTRNLLAAAAHSGADRFLAQSVAWTLPGDAGAAVEELERLVLAADGVVLRYGQFYGPGTYHRGQPPDGPRIRVDRAAARTSELLTTASGVVTIDEGATDPATGAGRAGSGR